MSWDDIIGHKRQIQVLRAGVLGRRIAHAYLFVGEPGLGKTTVADVLTRALLCEAEPEAIRPCGTCRSCRQSLDEHPDVFTIVPSGASIKIEQVRGIQRELLFSPVWGRQKVFRFSLADDLTEQAQNALLKSLEEPPAFASFILLSQHLHAVLSTVRSRCVHVRFGRVSTDEIAQALQKSGLDDKRAHMLAALSFGRPGMILNADVEAILERRERVIEWAEHLYRNPTAVWYVGEAMEKEREQAGLFIDMLIMWLRDVLLVCTGRSQMAANQDKLDMLSQSAQNVSPQGLSRAIQALLDLKEQWDANANFRLALDVALINIQRGLRSA